MTTEIQEKLYEQIYVKVTVYKHFLTSAKDEEWPCMSKITLNETPDVTCFLNQHPPPRTKVK